MRSPRSRGRVVTVLGALLAVLLGEGAGAVHAAPPIAHRAPEVPLAIPGPEVPIAADAGGDDESDGDAAPDDRSPSPPPPPPRIDPHATPLRVAVGLGGRAPGSRDELVLVDALERSAAASTAPRTEVRRLPAGASEPRILCRRGQDDLVIVIDYIAERGDPVVLSHDCGLDHPLGIRGAAAAAEPGLVGALWEERGELLRAGVRERRAPVLSPRVRRLVIGGAAVVAIGAALGVILASTLRPSTVVLTVGP